MTGRLIISLDFELHWGVYDKRTLDAYRENLEGTRPAIEALLTSFERWNIAATWAVVGMLMCDDVDHALSYEPNARGPADQGNAWDLLRQIRPQDAHLYFAPEVVAAIAATPRQEIATHTMAHLCMLERASTDEVIAADLNAAIRCAEAGGYALRSIVFPRNQYDGRVLQHCKAAGIETFRGQPALPWYHPRRDADQALLARAARLADSYFPCSEVIGAGTRRTRDERSACMDVPASIFLRPFEPRAARLETLKLRRILAAMRRAASRGEDFHLWWHPHNFGAHLDENMRIVEAIGAQFTMLAERYGMQSVTMHEAAQERRAS